jgi:hypothetical protein
MRTAKPGEAKARTEGQLDGYGGAPLGDYVVFGVCAALGAVLIGHWCYRRIVEYRSGRGGRRW